MFDINHDPAYTLELLKGIQPAQGSVFKTIFAPEGVREMSGSVPFIESAFTLLSDDANEVHKVGIQDEPTVRDLGLSSTEFRFDGKYAEEARIHKSTVNTLSKLKNAEDLVQYLGTLVLGFVNSAFDKDAANILRSTTLNATVAAGAAWGAAADVFLDFDAAVDLAGAPDICWLGLDKARKLAATDAFKAESGQNFSGTGARASYQQVVDILKKRYGFEKVLVDGKYHNEAGVFETISKARSFDGIVWIGHSEHMVTVERDDLREAATEFNGRSGNFSTYLTEYLDIARAEQNRGVVVTGT